MFGVVVMMEKARLCLGFQFDLCTSSSPVPTPPHKAKLHFVIDLDRSLRASKVSASPSTRKVAGMALISKVVMFVPGATVR